METRNQAKKTGVGNRVSNKSAPSVSELLCNKNGSSTQKNAPVLQLCRQTPPTQKIADVEKRKKFDEDTRRKEAEENKKKMQKERNEDLLRYNERLEVAKRDAIKEGRFKAANNSIREDGSIQLEGVDRGLSPFALELDLHDDLSNYTSCTPLRMEVDSSQRGNTGLATPVVEKRKRQHPWCK